MFLDHDYIYSTSIAKWRPREEGMGGRGKEKNVRKLKVEDITKRKALHARGGPKVNPWFKDLQNVKICDVELRFKQFVERPF